MESELKRLYLEFLKFHEKEFLESRKFWFGVEELKLEEKELKNFFLNYERVSFFEFLKHIKDIIYAREPLKETLMKWSMDNWYPYLYFKFLKDKKIIDFKKGGKIILSKKKLIEILPQPLSEKEVKEKLEKKFKIKLPLEAPANFLFKAKIKAEYDQLPISISSAIFETSKILEYLPLYKKFLFVGDDDFASIYLSLTDEKIESIVIDIDEDLLEKIKKISEKFKLRIKTIKANVFKEKKLKERIVGFLTSPVYTFEGSKKFFKFGLSQFGRDGGFAFLNLADEAIGNRYIFLEEFFVQKRLKIEEVVKGKIFYPWKLLHKEDKMVLKKYKEIFDQKIVENSPIISSTLWIFNFIPFKIKRPKKLPFYAYL